MARDIKYLEADLRKFIEKLVDKQMLEMFSERTREIMVNRTRSGKGLSKATGKIGGSTLKPLPKLSDSYKLVRQGKLAFFTIGTGPDRIVVPYVPKSQPKLSSLTRPRQSRSNLTFSGALLDSIVAKVRNNRGIVEIPNDGHPNSKLSMKELANLLEQGTDKIEARPFFGLADNEAKILESFIKREIRNKIRKQIKR